MTYIGSPGGRNELRPYIVLIFVALVALVACVARCALWAELEAAGDWDARDFWENISDFARDFLGSGWAYFDMYWCWWCDGLSGGHSGTSRVFL